MKVLSDRACLFALLVTTALANTEKAIFLAPQAIELPNATPGLDFLQLETITPHWPALRTDLPVIFPTEKKPHGQDHWYALRFLNERQRYELRLCWAAIQPTKFWLDVYTLSEVFDTPDLIQSLAAFVEDAEERRRPDWKLPLSPPEESRESVLFLHVRAAADFFTTNKTLMLEPPPVYVDFILDPYVSNVFPKSLGPTAAYLVVLAASAWYLSGYIWDFLRPAASPKKHED